MHNKSTKINRLANDLLLKAGEKVVDLFPKIQKIKDNKTANDLVTTADLASEKIILEGIRKHFPNHSTYSEEEGLNKMESDFKWFVDPLDGSKHIIKGLPYFAISIGVTYKNKIILGITYIPLLGQLFEARLGEGAYLNGKKISISNVSDLNKSIINAEFPSRNFKVDWSTTKYKQSFLQFEKLIKNTFRVRMIGSGPIGLAYTAMGGYDAYIRFQPFCIEDVIAGYLLIKEAGGEIYNFNGDDINVFESRNKFIAANRKLSNNIVKLVNNI